MASPKTWTVVHFIEDNSVEAVPTKWINGTRCLWPMLPGEKLNLAIRRQEFNTHWPDSQVRVLRNATFSDYTTARNKAKKAEEYSDLNSTDADDEVEVNTEKKRRIKRKVLTSDEDFLEEEIQPKKKSKLGIPLPPIWVENDYTPATPAAEHSDNYFTTAKEIDFYEDSLQEVTTANENFLESEDGHTSINKTTMYVDDEDLQVTPKQNPRQNCSESNDRPTSINKTAKCNSCGCSNSAMLYNIQNLLMDIKAKVDKIPLDVTLSSKTENQYINILQQTKLKFPIRDQDDFEQLDTFLTKEDNYSALVKFFSTLGGNSLYEFIKRCLGPVLGDEIAVNYSFIGRKGKRRFDNFQLSKAIIDSAEMARISNNKKETELGLGVWLRKAKERKTRSSNSKN